MTVRPQLGEFLRSRRSRVRPCDVGLPMGSDRRVAGLRREEVALLANVSVDYYVRLEQDRAPNPSAAVLDSLSSALKLTEAEHAHLRLLAAPPAKQRPEPAVVRPTVVAMITGLTETPAIVLDRLSNVIAWNAAAAALLTDFGALSPAERNLTRLYFLDPAARELYLDWKTVAKDVVGHLRRTSAEYADDPELGALVEELSTRCPEFATWWQGHDVSISAHCPKRLDHPVAGRLDLDLEVLELPGDHGQHLMTYTPSDGSTRVRLQALIRSHTREAWSA
ncbi:helix-turn-helix transcriptional regulator [Kribbella sp. ALI-6-A]|uniref:helix-turn-helix transcriptional regulator n=1 Tax=Kribbella sp. ALI-6-A TaxID=1933817 RepID=UPI00143CCFE4|nr:helix-turn-helix transcriptional regulator [Kribbella sp. ALI-6-A]